VIAQAGRKGAITVSTNMAGRGTDIILGGNAEMMAKIEFLENNRLPDDEPIEHPWVTKSVQNAQQKVEERNFDIRKNLLEYDDVMSAQRKTVYTMRQQMLEGRYRPEEVNEDGKPVGEVKE